MKNWETKKELIGADRVRNVFHPVFGSEDNKDQELIEELIRRVVPTQAEQQQYYQDGTGAMAMSFLGAGSEDTATAFKPRPYVSLMKKPADIGSSEGALYERVASVTSFSELRESEDDDKGVRYNPEPATYGDLKTLLEPLPEPASKFDPVEKPKHYNVHPSGVECITVTQHMNFCLGNAIKYIWRAGIKSDDAVQDLKKAVWYLNTEIARLS